MYVITVVVTHNRVGFVQKGTQVLNEHLLISPRAALWTLENGAGSCGADLSHLFWQQGTHVDIVVKQRPAFGTAWCYRGDRSFIQTAAAAAATVAAQSCGPQHRNYYTIAKLAVSVVCVKKYLGLTDLTPHNT